MKLTTSRRSLICGLAAAPLAAGSAVLAHKPDDADLVQACLEAEATARNPIWFDLGLDLGDEESNRAAAQLHRALDLAASLPVTSERGRVAVARLLQAGVAKPGDDGAGDQLLANLLAGITGEEVAAEECELPAETSL